MKTDAKRGNVPWTRLLKESDPPFLAEKAFWASKNNAKMTGLEEQVAYLEWKSHPNFGSNSARIGPQKRIAEKIESSTYC
jgi:hypothetical protein